MNFHRKCASLSFEEITKRTGIDKDKLIQFESGLEIPSYETITTLAKAMNVNSRDLLPPDTIEDKVIVQHTTMNHQVGIILNLLRHIRLWNFVIQRTYRSLRHLNFQF